MLSLIIGMVVVLSVNLLVVCLVALGASPSKGWPRSCPIWYQECDQSERDRHYGQNIAAFCVAVALFLLCWACVIGCVLEKRTRRRSMHEHWHKRPRYQYFEGENAIGLDFQ
jgi:hypothetical protein